MSTIIGIGKCKCFACSYDTDSTPDECDRTNERRAASDE